MTKTTIGAIVGLCGLLGAVAYRFRYALTPAPWPRQRRIEDIIREAASEDAHIYAD